MIINRRFSLIYYLKQIILLVSFLSFFPSIVLSADNISKGTKELYVKSGLKTQIDSFSSILLTQIDAEIKNDPDKNKYKPNEIKKLAKTIKDVFGASDLSKKSLKILSQELSQAETKNLLNWFHSAVGKKVAWYEDHISTRAGYFSMNNYEKNITKNPPTEDYKHTIKQLTSNMKVMEAAADIALTNEILVKVAMASLLPNFTTDIFDKISSKAERNKNALKKKVEEDMSIIMLFSYSYLSKEEVNKYLEFTSTPLGKKYFPLMVKALNLTFSKASLEFKDKRLEAVNH